MAHSLQDRFASLIDDRLRAELVTVDQGAVPIFNTKYEGDPKAGAVKVPVRGEMVTGAYNKVTGLAPSEGSTTYLTITIDNDIAVNEIIDGYDAEAVPDNLVADRLDAAGYAGALVLDNDAIDTLEAEGTAFTPTGTTAYDKVVEAGAQLTKNNVPLRGRFLIASPDFYAEILKDDFFIKTGDLSQDLVMSGVVGMIGGFAVRVSNNIAATNDFIVGHSNWCHRVREWMVTPFLANLNGSREMIGASAVKGRWVFTHKVSKPEAVLVVAAPVTP